jgi:proteasome lid subunit RPN8/RPN11
MNVAISRALLEGLVRDTEAAGAKEICGLLVGEPGLITGLLPMNNVHSKPAQAFALDPAEHVVSARQAREAGKQILGHYHSHPSGDAAPSASDAAEAQEQGVYWLIVTAREARLWISRRNGSFHQAFEPVGLLLS